MTFLGASPLVQGLHLKMMPEKRRRENLLLAALPESERERLDPFLEYIEMQIGMPVTEPDEPIPYLYFPYDAVTSTTQEMADGSMIETGLMGIEGLAGVQVWLGQRTTAATTFVQVPGWATGLKPKILFAKSGTTHPHR